jgi:prevent-host-death family protein
VFVSTSNQTGAVAEAEIAAAAVRLGVPVLRPISDHARYDLAFELGGRILRVQCKSGFLDERARVIKVNLQSSWCTPGGYVRKTYGEGEIDLIAVYCAALDRCYLLSGPLLVDRRAVWLRLEPPRNGQRACINLASDFEFAGAVAQLGERLSGTQKATGSSPVSSTPSGGGAVRHVGANKFRNHFGYYMERAAAGEEVLVTRHGRPFVRLSGVVSQPALTPVPAA